MSSVWPSREALIQGMCERNGKTREQNLALLEMLGSALNRRAGEGKTLDREQLSVRLGRFVGGTLVDGD